MKRIGVLGGTFDPVHVGHLAAAAAARHALRLDRMLLVVANHPWQKADDRRLTPAEDRYAVTAAAAAEIEGLEVSRIEIDRGGESYMADTLAELAAADPGAELFLVLGADVASQLETWVRWEEIQRLAALAVVPRPGVLDPPDLHGWRHETVGMPWLDVSSSMVRAMAAEGRPLDGLVPPAALRCIRERGLYAG